MKKTNRKAFTIVELVIVIAVIAILAAVLIPTFSDVIKSAQKSTDMQLVKNLNTGLKIEENIHGKPETMQQAITIVQAAGFSVEGIKAAVDGNLILWDSVNNVFCYKNGDKFEYIPENGGSKPDDYKLWAVVDTVDPDCEYSQYLNDADFTGDVTVNKAGFDAGFAGLIGTVNVNNDSADKKLMVRTVGGNLNINVPNADVYIYGVTDLLTVLDSAPASTHIRDAFVKELVVEDNDGHVVLESGAQIMRMEVNAGSIDVQTGSQVVYMEVNAGSVAVSDSDSVVSYYAADAGVTVSGVSETKKVDEPIEVATACAEDAHTPTTYELGGVRVTVCVECGSFISMEFVETVHYDTDKKTEDETTGGDDEVVTDDPNSNTHTIKTTLSHVTANSNNATSIDIDGNVTLTFTAASGYVLPESITVTGAEYTWNKANGTVTVSNPTDVVRITITGLEPSSYVYYLTDDFANGKDNHYTAGFTCNGTHYKELYHTCDSEDVDLKSIIKYKADDDTYVTVYSNGAWANEAYRIVEFDSEPQGAKFTEFLFGSLTTHTGGCATAAEVGKTISSGTYDGIIFIDCTITKGTFYECSFIGTTTITGGTYFYRGKPTDGFNKKLASGYGFFDEAAMDPRNGREYRVMQGEVWYINEKIQGFGDAEKKFSNLNYKKGGSTSTISRIIVGKDGASLILSGGTVESYTSESGWDYPEDRWLAFGTAPSGDLLTWLQANAVKQDPANYTFKTSD